MWGSWVCLLVCSCVQFCAGLYARVWVCACMCLCMHAFACAWVWFCTSQRKQFRVVSVFNVRVWHARVRAPRGCVGPPIARRVTGGINSAAARAWWRPRARV